MLTHGDIPLFHTAIIYYNMGEKAKQVEHSVKHSLTPPISPFFLYLFTEYIYIYKTHHHKLKEMQ